MIIFDSSVFSVGEMRNRAFRQKIHATALSAIVGADLRYVLYDFQEDDAGLVGATNVGTSGFLGNMAWTNLGLRSGNGWYVHPCPGAKGFGMVNDGGASGFVGSVVNHTGINMSGAEHATWIFIVNLASAGEVNQGRFFQRDPGEAYAFVNALGNLEFVLNGGSAGAINAAEFGFWHVIVVTYDGTQAVGSRTKIYRDGIDITAADDTPASLTDTGEPTYFLDNGPNTRAMDGIMGLMGIIPYYTMSPAEVASLVEPRGHFQPAAATQPLIHTPGTWNSSDYVFDGAAAPNGDHLLSFQATPFKTAQGTIIVNFTPTDMVNQQMLAGVSEYGIANEDEVGIHLRGDIANDPIEWHSRINGALSFRLQIPFGAGNLNVPTQLVFTSDGTTLRGFLGGEEQVVAAVVGANTGQWFDHATSADIFNIGASSLDTIQNMYTGGISKIVVRDDCLAPIQIAKLAQSSALGWNRQYGT